MPFSMVGTLSIHARIWFGGICIWCQISLFPCMTRSGCFGTWKNAWSARPFPYVHFAKHSLGVMSAILEWVCQQFAKNFIGKLVHYDTQQCKHGMLFGVDYTVPNKSGQDVLGNLLNGNCTATYHASIEM